MPPRIAVGMVLDSSIPPSLPPSIISGLPGALCLRHQTHPRPTRFGGIDNKMTMSAAHEKASRPSANAQLPAAQPGDVAEGSEEQRDALSDGDRSRRRAASRQQPAQAGSIHPTAR